MEKRLSGPSHVASLTAPLRELLGASKEKISPELKAALQLLHLKNLDALENHLLATDAFLKPWSQFRDTWFMLQTDDSSRASPPGKLKATGILWYYTTFLEGELRYDARCDDSTSVFTTDETKYGTYDDQHWGVEEHEKMMYAWLLQEFRVGKARNPFGFKYFEHRNIIAAWKNVFVPIVNTVRDSYDVKGRRHYGRLATFIENRYPSRLAFPEGNIGLAMDGSTHRMVSVTRAHGGTVWSGAASNLIPRTDRHNTKKEYAEFEQELRVVYPKYGQVVERPKFTTRMEDWLEAQKQRSQQKKRAKELNGKKPLILAKRRGKESPDFGCRGIDDEDVRNTMAASVANSTPRCSTSGHAVSSSPRSPTSSKPPPESPSRRVPYGMYGHKEAPVVPRKNKDSPNDKHAVQPAAAWKPDMNRLDSDGVYTTIRNSNPFTEEKPGYFGESAELRKSASLESMESNMAQKSAIPTPLFGQKSNAHKPKSGPSGDSGFVRAVQEAKVRAPSYEGNAYERDITPSFTERKMRAAAEHQARQGDRLDQSSRNPEPVYPTDEKGAAYHIPQKVPWPGQTPQFQPTDKTKWPSERTQTSTPPPPPIPTKSPERHNSVRDSQNAESSRQSILQPPVYPTLGPRIISVENIRAHLSISSQTSHENLQKVDEETEKKQLPPLPLRTYNSHMFPRKETPLSGSDTARYIAGGEYEMVVLRQNDAKKGLDCGMGN
jgi:hypothetical protein